MVGGPQNSTTLRPGLALGGSDRSIQAQVMSLWSLRTIASTMSDRVSFSYHRDFSLKKKPFVK